MEVADSRERTGSRTSRLEAGRPALPAGPDRATLVRGVASTTETGLHRLLKLVTARLVPAVRNIDAMVTGPSRIRPADEESSK